LASPNRILVFWINWIMIVTASEWVRHRIILDAFVSV